MRILMLLLQGRTVFKVACDDSEQIIMDMIMEKLTYLNPDDFEVTQYRIDYLGKIIAPTLLPTSTSSTLISYWVVKNVQNPPQFYTVR